MSGVISITVVAWDDRVFPVQLDAAENLATLQAIIEAESGVPTAQQQLVLQGRPLPASAGGQALAALGVIDGELIMLLPAAGAGAQPQPSRANAGAQREAAALELAEDGSARTPVAFIQAVKGRPELMAQLHSSNPALASAVHKEDVEALQAELRSVHRQRREAESAAAREAELLSADPFDAESQRRIEELIQRQQIEENFAAALEHNPESFGTVIMLYVNMEVNGVPVKAFVDSGAQMTIMTQEFASKCYLTRLLDKRFQGMAVGVGSSRILGRIHQAPLKVSGHFTACSITVLEQRDGPQFIFGLDMLKRHQCVLDLAAGVLRFGSCDAVLSFLPEHEIPRDFHKAIEEVSSAQAEKNREAGASSNGGAATADPGQAPQAKAPEVAASPTPATAPSATSPSAAATTTAAGGAADPPGLAQLVALGFSREVATRALQAAGGDADAAAAMLFGM